MTEEQTTKDVLYIRQVKFFSKAPANISQLVKYRQMPADQQEYLLEELDNFEAWLNMREAESRARRLHDDRPELGSYKLKMVLMGTNSISQRKNKSGIFKK